MSGYDSKTGWIHLTPTKVRRYARGVDGLAADLDERLADAEVEFYWDAAGGLHAHCVEGRLWELLSGRRDERPAVDSGDAVDREWISVTDLGAIVEPPLATSTVLKLLRQEGLLERVAGRDVPTPAAEGLYQERVAESTSRFGSAPGAMQRRWAYEVLVRLRARAPSLPPTERSKALAERGSSAARSLRRSLRVVQGGRT